MNVPPFQFLLIPPISPNLFLIQYLDLIVSGTVRHNCLIVVAICICSPVYAEKLQAGLGFFFPDQAPVEAGLSERIILQLEKELIDAGYLVTRQAGDSVPDRINTARETGSTFLIEGVYRRSPRSRNLNLYGFIYNPRTGYLADALALPDELETLEQEGIRGDLTELVETDEVRIARFAKRILARLKANPNLTEARGNIVDNVFAYGLDKRHNIPIQKGTDLRTPQEVFDVLQSQLTSISTRVSIRQNEAPGIVSVISKEEILAYGWLSLNDVLYHLPGFAPSMDYDRRTVSSRGLFESWNNSHLLMLVDGIPFNDILYGTAYTWEILPLGIFKSVEVGRGPGSALYGSNATNGVISLTTFSGSDLNGGVITRIRAGNGATHIFDIMTGNRTKYTSYVVALSQYGTHGNEYDDYDGSGRSDLGYLRKFTVRDGRKNDYVMTKFEGEDFLRGFALQYHRQYWDFQTGHGWIWRIPDFSESMSESMQNVALSFQRDVSSKFSHEYMIRYQRRDIEWDTRYAENNAFQGAYPTGISEYLKTAADQYFVRGQWTFRFANRGSILGGVEGSVLKYRGDSEHYSNINLRDAAGGFPPNAQGYAKQGPWLEWIKNRPIPIGSVYGQIVSGKLWDLFEITVGGRFDEEKVRFRGIDQPFSSVLGFPYIPEERRVFRRTSPRAGIVFFVTPSLSLKALTGQAFRVPSVTELFGANTFSLASNPRKLKPEFVRTSELALDWSINRYVTFRTNVFRTRFENQIAYSTQNNNLSTNIYTLTTVGAEGELLVTWKSIAGFVNASYNKRVGEVILDNTVAQSPDATTWAPSHTGSMGVRAMFTHLSMSLSAQRQGLVRRRTSDFGKIDPLTGFGPVDAEGRPISYENSYPVYRPKAVSAWTDVGTRIAWRFGSGEAGISVANALNSHQTLIKNNNYPFDYIREGRRYLFDVRLAF